ncbi:phage portal protein [Nonomuraea angiospora]
MRSPLGALARALTNKSPVPYAARNIRHALPFGHRNDAEAQMRAMGSVGTLFAIVHRSSNATSQLGWHLWRKAPSGKTEDRVEVTSHLALDIWSRPNPFMPRQEFVETFQQHKDLVGEAWWVVARSPRMRSIPLELWPVRPDRMYPVPDPAEFLAGYIYTGPDGEQVPLKLDEVIQLRLPNPLDIYRGMGPVQAILADLDATRYSAEWNRNFFVNSALPSGIIEAPENLGDEEFNELRDRWDEQHRGVAAAHRVAILEGGLKWVDRKFTQRDMQFAELREISRETIREAFGFPKAMLGSVEDVNRANADAGEVMFARWLIKPRLEAIKQALNFEFLPLFGDTARDLEFDYDDPVPEDREAANAELTAKAQAAKMYVEAHFNGNSVKEALELPDALEWEGRPEPAVPAIAPPVPAPAPDEPPAAAALLAHLRGELPRAQDDDEDRVDRLVEQAMNAIRTAFESALEALLAAWDSISAAWRRDLVDQVRQAVDDDDVAALARLVLDTDDAETELTTAMVALARAAAQQVVDEAAAQGVNVEPADPDEDGLGATAVVVVALLAAGLAGAAAREALRVWGPDAQANDVAHQVDEHLRSLSDRPLRDELGGALHHAQQSGRMDTLEDAPDPEVWIASERNDANSCQPCRDVDDERFTDYATARAAYPVGAYVSCLGRTRCRGTIVPIWEES